MEKPLVIAACLAVVWSVSSTAAPPIPAALQPYVHDGRYDPGDYAWMRGAFSSASAAEKATFETVMSWVNKCFVTDREQARSELQAMGIEKPDVEQLGLRDPLCSAVAFVPFGKNASYAALQEGATEARPYVTSYLFAVRNTQRITGSGGSYADQLKNRVLIDQLVRISWGEGNWADAPRLSPDAKALVDAQLGAAMVEADHMNTNWLKAVVSKGGWPTISQVGKEATGNAWLLIQHADADPAFQLKVLRLMEPLVAKGEVDKQNYALLFDRVTLKTVGRQRYGTQVTCSAGKRVPQPVEDSAQLASRRARMGLPSMAEYLKTMDDQFGSCPPAP